jgi:ribonuclease P protein component
MTGPQAGRATLGRGERVISPATFRAVYAARARAGDGRLVVYARASGLSVTRLGLSVGRRSGGAVARNRTKRLLREVFRRARADWPTGYDVVVVTLGRDYTLKEVDERLRTLVPEALRRAQRRADDDAGARGATP